MSSSPTVPDRNVPLKGLLVMSGRARDCPKGGGGGGGRVLEVRRECVYSQA